MYCVGQVSGIKWESMKYLSVNTTTCIWGVWILATFRQARKRKEIKSWGVFRMECTPHFFIIPGSANTTAPQEYTSTNICDLEQSQLLNFEPTWIDIEHVMEMYAAFMISSKLHQTCTLIIWTIQARWTLTMLHHSTHGRGRRLGLGITTLWHRNLIQAWYFINEWKQNVGLRNRWPLRITYHG